MPDLEQDYSGVSDYTALKVNITNILKRYFYDTTFSAQDAINEIHDLIGDI